MKTTYITPDMVVLELATETMIATSGVNSEGIGYGGVDEDGSIIPSSNDRRGAWGDLWE